MIAILIKDVDKKEIKKILFGLTKDIILYCIKQRIMDDFLKQKLDVKYKNKIEAWFTYLDQKEFGLKLSKRILEEVNNYMATKKSTDEIVSEMFEEPKWIIEIEEGLIEKYPEFKYATNLILGYA